MKKLFILLLVWFAHQNIHAQKKDSFVVLIDDKECIVTPENRNVEAIPRHIFGGTPQDLRVNRKGATWGLVQPVHFYFAKNQWYSMHNNFLFTPFDFRKRYTNQEKFNFYRLEIKSTSSFYFHTKNKLQNSTLNIKDRQGSLHQLVFKWPSTIRIAARVGAEYQQYSMKEFSSQEMSINNVIINRTTELRGQKQLTFTVGLSRQQVKGFKCDFCELGPYDSFNIREWYIDGIAAPFQQVYGAATDSTSDNTLQVAFEEKRITDFDYKMVRLGGRIGFRRIGVWAKLPQVVMSFGAELGWYTGPSVYNFEFSLKLGFYLRRLKGLVQSGIDLIP